jgi:serine/threonine protein kinase
MRLSPGTRMGAYEVVALIGAGGMGEVYRAVDTGLGRDVAIKVLPLEFSADPERVGRFEREARTLALLNHPNIATVHGYEHATASTAARPISIPALVMEFVDGRRWQIALRKDASRPARMFFTRVHTRVLHVRSPERSPRGAHEVLHARGSSRGSRTHLNRVHGSPPLPPA